MRKSHETAATEDPRSTVKSYLSAFVRKLRASPNCWWRAVARLMAHPMYAGDCDGVVSSCSVGPMVCTVKQEQPWECRQFTPLELSVSNQHLQPNVKKLLSSLHEADKLTRDL